RLEQFRGGQSNPTYRVSAGAACCVLRKKPPGVLLPSAHAIEREYRVMRALAASDVRVPRVLALCEDPAVIGTAFFVMGFVDGRISWAYTLPDVPVPECAALFDKMNRVIATLHGIDHEAARLTDYGRPGNSLRRQIARWTRQYRASETRPIDAMERLIA